MKIMKWCAPENNAPANIAKYFGCNTPNATQSVVKQYIDSHQMSRSRKLVQKKTVKKTEQKVRSSFDSFNQNIRYKGSCGEGVWFVHKSTTTTTQAHLETIKMGKSNASHLLHITYERIITYMCYTALLIAYKRFYGISLVGVMSMKFPNENNELTTAGEAVNLSSIKLGEKHAISFSSDSPISIVSSKLDFGTTDAVDSSPITGWQCNCWIHSTGYEVTSFLNLEK